MCSLLPKSNVANSFPADTQRAGDLAIVKRAVGTNLAHGFVAQLGGMVALSILKSPECPIVPGRQPPNVGGLIVRPIPVDVIGVRVNGWRRAAKGKRHKTMDIFLPA